MQTKKFFLFDGIVQALKIIGYWHKPKKREGDSVVGFAIIQSVCFVASASAIIYRVIKRGRKYVSKERNLHHF